MRIEIDAKRLLRFLESFLCDATPQRDQRIGLYEPLLQGDHEEFAGIVLGDVDDRIAVRK